MTEDEILAEIHGIFGDCPLVFQRMREAGELERQWPQIRAVEIEPGPIPGAVVQAMLGLLALRCSSSYCFTMHSLTLAGEGASLLAIAELARAFDMPPIVDDHERWSRVLKLAWLARVDGEQREAADFLLRQFCSEEEYAQIQLIYEVDGTLTGFTPGLDPREDPILPHLPAELRAVIPEFVHFHVQVGQRDAGDRPVSVMCSVCRQVRSTAGDWYPYGVARELLDDDALFSHGLCPGCLEDQGVPPELC